jgi:hypothetical protein
MRGQDEENTNLRKMSSCCWPAQRPRTHSRFSLITRKLRYLKPQPVGEFNMADHLVAARHRLNIEVDLQSLFGLHVT